MVRMVRQLGKRRTGRGRELLPAFENLVNFAAMDLYLLPGLGSDGRLFDRLDLTGHDTHRFDWPTMPEGSTMRDYAEVLAPRVDATKPHVLIGVSMGGMVAQEMAALTKPVRTIIISSWKGPQEMPNHLRLLRGMHAEKLMTPLFMRTAMPLVRYQMGLETKEDIALFDAFVASTPLEQLRIQIAAVLGWEGPTQPVKALTHIHGDHDRLMPIAHIQQSIVVRGGGHFMVFNRAEAISKALRKALLT
ncbi:MAG: alpha/beta hydrolase [Flavobacteriales bacterium]|nr:alpha/beta hydrolase [Flavobacteriales bacterium]